MTEDFIVEDGILISYKGKSKDVIMPDGIVRIGDSAFSRKAITSVTMPDSVESIGFGAFSDCKKLTNVVLSKNLKSIGINAFLFCDSLEKIGFPEGLEEIGICAFSGCLHLKEALLPKSISKIGSAAFSGCSELVSIGNVNPEAVIGKTAFDECVGLADENGFVIVNGCLYCISPATDSQAFEIPDSVSRIEGVFGRNLRFDRKISLMIPSSVKHIDDGCLSGRRAGVGYSSIRIDMEVDDSKEIKRLVYKVFDFEQLADLFLRDGLVVGKSIRDYMVKEVSSKKNRDSFMSRYLYSKESKPLANLLSCVKKIPLDELDAYIDKTNDVEMKTMLLNYKNRLYSPKEVEQINQTNDNKEMGLVEKTLADYRKDFKIIKKGDAYEITGYKGASVEVVVPGTIKGVTVNIGERAFQDRWKIEKVTILDGVERIGAFAFAGCKSLKYIYVPASVKECDNGGYSNDCIFFGCGKFEVDYPDGCYMEEYVKKNFGE